jgi:hypothetical protein
MCASFFRERRLSNCSVYVEHHAVSLNSPFNILQLAVEYEDNALFVKVDTDDEYEFAKDMQVHPRWHSFKPTKC